MPNQLPPCQPVRYEGAPPVNGPISSHRRRRIHSPWFAAVAVLATGAVAAPLTAVPAAADPATAVAATGPVAGGLRPLAMPGLNGSNLTVTLITGDQITLTPVAPGQYTFDPAPGTGTVYYSVEADASGITSLRTIPVDAAGLNGPTRVDQGLFDVHYLAENGHVGPDARIPVTVRYPGQPDPATLDERADSLPGATVLGTRPADGEVDLAVPAAHAAEFWAALTEPAGAATSGLAGDAVEIWLTGHKTAAANPTPQAGEPLYTVSYRITSPTSGPVWNGIHRCGTVPDVDPPNFVPAFAVRYCPTPPFAAGSLWGLAGAGKDTAYGTATDPTCIRTTPAEPLPICAEWELTFRVPAGIYAAQSRGVLLTEDNPDQTLEVAHVNLDVPQFTVTGDITIRLDAGQAVPVTYHTPHSDAVLASRNSLWTFRSLPDGSSTGVGVSTTYSESNFMVLPTPAGHEATLGSYKFSVQPVLGRRPVTAAVTAPERINLHPMYPCHTNSLNCLHVGSTGFEVAAPTVRFSGRQRLQLIDAGEGGDADFAGMDARGKLVLIHPNATCDPSPWPGQPRHECSEQQNPPHVNWEVLVNAHRAGAAGVLFDAGFDRYGYPHWLRVSEKTPKGTVDGQPFTMPQIPMAQITGAEARALRDLLAEGPVTIDIKDNGQTPYLYHLRFNESGQIPDRLDYTVTHRQLAQVDESYHSASADPWLRSWSLPTPHDAVPITGSWADLRGSGSVREYYGPISPDLVWQRRTQRFTPDTTTHRQIFSASTDGAIESLFDEAGRDTLTWNQAPTAPGALALTPDVAAAQPGNNFLMLNHFCAGCRQGSDFWPVFFHVNGANPGDWALFGGFAPGSIQLYDEAGDELAQEMQRGVVTYRLPAEEQRYTLSVAYQLDNPALGPPSTTTTTWEFTSGEAAEDHTPVGTLCPGTAFRTSAAPCEPAPLVFLRYDTKLDRDNTAPARGAHRMEVTAYHQDPAAPAITGLKVWTSTDGGQSWRPAKVKAGKRMGGERTYQVTATYPRLSETSGTVSLKAEAWDADGNRIEQVIKDAFTLTDHRR